MDRVEELFGGGSVINEPTSSSFHTTRQILHYFRLSPKKYIVDHGRVSFFYHKMTHFFISSWVLYYRQLKSGVKAHFQHNATWIFIVRFFNDVK